MKPKRMGERSKGFRFGLALIVEGANLGLLEKEVVGAQWPFRTLQVGFLGKIHTLILTKVGEVLAVAIETTTPRCLRRACLIAADPR